MMAGRFSQDSYPKSGDSKMEFETQTDPAKGLQRILSRCVEKCGHSRREIARRAGINKDTLNRVLAGSREAAFGEARRILAATGHDPDSALLLLLYDGEEFEWLWRERKALSFLTALFRSMPRALDQRLSDRVVELRPTWGAGAAHAAARAVARLIDDLEVLDQQFGQERAKKRRSKPRSQLPSPEVILQ